MFQNVRFTIALSFLVVASVLLGAGIAVAEPRQDRQGFFVGLDIGAGGAGFEFEKGGRKYEYRDHTGSALALRAGYVFNPYVSLAFEGRGFDHTSGDFETRLCSQALVATVYPRGGGFFLRAGVGPAKFQVEMDSASEDGVLEEIDEMGGAVALGLGYDWFVNEHFAIGLSAETRGAVFEDFGEFDELAVGEGTVGVTMNYYF